VPNGSIIFNDVLGRMWKEEVMTYFKALYQQFNVDTEENMINLTG
jgi:hypothetical protein